MSDTAPVDVHPAESSLLARFWDALPARTIQTLVAPLLATLVLLAMLVLWYAVPQTAGLGLSANQVALIGFAVWFVVLVILVLVLREARSGWPLRIAMISTSHTLRGIDLLLLLLAIVLLALGHENPITWLIAGTVAFSLLVLALAPERDVYLEESSDELRARIRRTLDPDARPEQTLSTELTAVEVTWDMRPLDEEHTGRTTIMLNLDRLHSMRRLNPESPNRIPGVPYHQAAVNEWIVRGTTEEVDRLALALSDYAAARDFTPEQRTKLVLAMVQAMEYTTDRESMQKEEYWRYPIETLADQVGDCEDSTILAAAVLRRMGFDVCLMFTKDHCALGVADLPAALGTYIDYRGRRYSYCETTSEGWAIGQLPRGISRDDFEMIAPTDRLSLAGVAGD